MEKAPCAEHKEQIKTLFKRVDSVEAKIDDMHDMKLAINSISFTMKSIQEHNERQDIWNKEMYERQSQLNERQNNTLDKINENLNKLNTGQDKLESQVASLKRRVDDNETKNTIDLRDLNKKKYTDIFFKYVIPTGGGVVILLKLLEVFKG